MTDHTPTTADVCGSYVQFFRKSIDWSETQTLLDEFNRWLDQTLQGAKAEAWEEGHEAAAMRVPEGVWHDTASPRTPNPYRQETGA